MPSTYIPMLAIQINNVAVDWSAISDGAVYFLVAVAIIFAVLVLATSILRFQHIIGIDDHGEDLQPEDAFVIGMVDRIAVLRNRPPPFWLILLSINAVPKEEGAALAGLRIPSLLEDLHSILRLGDEFSISESGEIALLLEAPRQRIEVAQQRLRKHIENLNPVDEEGTPYIPDIRFGCASFPKSGEKVDLLFTAAREALAKAEESSARGHWEFEPPLAEPAAAQEKDAAENEEQTSVPAYIDPATGLLKSARSRSTAQKFLSQFRREGDHASIMIVKADDLDRLQQDYGDEVMEPVRVAISSELQANLRDDDLIACWGDDAFLVGLEADSDAAAEVARRLIALLRRKKVAHEGYRLRVSVSIGTATYPKNGRLPREILAAAEAAQREARDMGRNVFAAFEPKMLKRDKRKERSGAAF